MKNSFGSTPILEQQIEQMLTSLHVNPDVQGFMLNMQDAVKDFAIERFIPRIKTINSAQRTARVKGFKSIDDANDYIGVSFIISDLTQIPEISKRLQKMYPNSETVDLSTEESIYAPLAYIKKVPPLAYSILTRQDIGEQKGVPVEVRLTTKQGYITVQSTHDTVYKNDDLDIPFDEKVKLLSLSQHIVYKLALLDKKVNITPEGRRKHEEELREILDNNKAFLAQYAEPFKKVIIEYGTSVYEYERKDELSKIAEDEKKKVLNNVRSQYAELYEQKGQAGMDFVQRVNESIESLKNRNISSFREGLEPE